MKKLILTILLVLALVGNVWCAEIDYMEYSSDGAVRAEYIASGVAPVVTQSDLIQNDNGNMYDTYNRYFAQGFQVSTTDNITKFSLYMRKVDSPDGTLTGYIYDDDNSAPNNVVATFSNMAVSSLTTSWVWYDFTGTFTPSTSTQYYIVINITGQTQGNVQVGFNNSHPYANGGMWYNNGALWVDSSASYDLTFKVWQNDNDPLAYSEATIKQQGSYSLKFVTQQTESLNETLTRTIGSPIDLSGINKVKFYIRASRTGSNIKIGLHDSGGTTSETTPNITDANTWQEVEWDISGVSNANKDAIDSIIITVVNADATNTFYIDNMITGGGLPRLSIMGRGIARGIGRGMR